MNLEPDLEEDRYILVHRLIEEMQRLSTGALDVDSKRSHDRDMEVSALRLERSQSVSTRYTIQGGGCFACIPHC